jgi:hypothetical protein
VSSREVSGDRPHREQTPPVTARQDAYLQWRQRIADKQATRRQPDETPTPKRNSQWDPEALFRADEPAAPSPEPAPVPAPTIDLRAGAEVIVAPEPLEAAPSRPARPASRARRDPRAQRLQSVKARLGPPAPAPERPTTGSGSVEPPPPADPASTAVDLTPIGQALRELNEERVEGTITDEEFNARKAAIFARASRR